MHQNFKLHYFGLNSNKSIVLEVGGCSIVVINRTTLLEVRIDSKLTTNMSSILVRKQAAKLCMLVCMYILTNYTGGPARDIRPCH